MAPAGSASVKPSSAGWRSGPYAKRTPSKRIAGAEADRRRRGRRGGLGIQDGGRGERPFRVEHLRDARRRLLPRHPRVEGGAESAQRPVELGGEDEHEQRFAKPDPRVEETQPHLDRDYRRPQRRERLEHERRDEGEAQHAHGHRAVPLARPGDRVGLVTGPPERAQRGEALERVEEARGQARERRPLPAGLVPRRLPDEPHEERDEREGQQEHEGGERVRPQDGGEDEEGDEGREVRLGQVLGEVRVERVHPRGEGVRELARALARGEARAQREQPAEEVVAHGQADCPGMGLRQDLLAPGRGRAQRGRPCEPEQEGRDGAEVAPPEKDGGDRRGQQPRLDDHEGAGHDSQRNGEGEAATRPRPRRDDPGERPHPVTVSILELRFRGDPVPEDPVRPGLVGEDDGDEDARHDGHDLQGVRRRGSVVDGEAPLRVEARDHDARVERHEERRHREEMVSVVMANAQPIFSRWMRAPAASSAPSARRGTRPGLTPRRA